jgi:type I restriction enzyme S subunit
MTEELWSLPKSWKWMEFRDVADVELELVDAKRFPDAIHIAPNHIESGTGRLLGMGTVAGDSVLGPKHRFERGHLLYSKIRPYLAKAVIAPCDGFCSSDMYPLRPRFSTEFLLNWLVSSAFTHRVSRDQNRTVLPKVNLATLRELPVPVAPLNEQRRIVAKLEVLQARSRRAREAFDAVPPLLEKLRQSILAAAFRGDLTKDWRAKQKDIEPATEVLKRIRAERRQKWEASELGKLKSKGKPPSDGKWKVRYREPEAVDISQRPGLPDGWCWASLDELAHIGTGATPKRGEEKYYLGGTIAWVTSGALNDEVVVEATELVTEQAVAKTNLTVYPPGTLLLAMYGEGKTRGMVSELRIEATTNQAIAAICLSGLAERVKDLVRLALTQNYAQIRSASMGGVQPNLNLEKVRALAVPLCPVEEMSVLVSAVRAGLERVSFLSAIAGEQTTALSMFDRSVLAKAFRGELVPQDPNDEPAEAMLARARPTNGSAPADGAPQKRGRQRSAQRADQPND